jgi:hypothetical protein
VPQMRELNRDFEALVEDGERPLTADEAREAIRRFIARPWTRSWVIASLSVSWSYGSRNESTDHGHGDGPERDRRASPSHTRLARGELSHLSRDGPRRPSTLSIVGQCLYYRLCSPVALRLIKRRGMTPSLVEALAQHIADFSLKALAVRRRDSRRGPAGSTQGEESSITGRSAITRRGTMANEENGSKEASNSAHPSSPPDCRGAWLVVLLRKPPVPQTSPLSGRIEATTRR